MSISKRRKGRQTSRPWFDRASYYWSAVWDSADITKPYLILGAVLVFLLFGVLGSWSAIASIHGAVVAPGSLAVESNSRTVQHLDGGIVGKIIVRDGDLVSAGDVLLRLDETVPRANLSIIENQLDELMGRMARLQAERDGADKILFPSELKSRAELTHVLAVIRGQTKLFEARIISLDGERAQLREQIEQIQQEIRGLEAQRDAKAKEIPLIADELNGLNQLYKKGLVPKPRMAALQRKAAQLEGDYGRLESEIARAGGRISETRMRILQLERDRRTEVVSELREVHQKVAEYSERKIAARDQMRRIDVRAPIKGYVHDLVVHTVGGVISAGQPIVQIVPSKDRLLAEAHVSPNDIDQVNMNQIARIRLSSFNQRTTPELMGHVRHVSADLIVEPDTKTQFYKVLIEFDEGEIARLNGKRLMPGMPSQVLIQTQYRTALSYLLKPLTDQLNRAFREE